MDEHKIQRVRLARSDDDPSILNLLRQISSAVSGHSSIEGEPSDDDLRKIIKNCTTFVVEADDNKVVGLNALRVLDTRGRKDARYRRGAFIMAIGVDEESRRKGFGSALVDHMWRWLDAEEIEIVSLNVAAKNEAARAFYQKVGFETLSFTMGRVRPFQ